MRIDRVGVGRSKGDLLVEKHYSNSCRNAIIVQLLDLIVWCSQVGGTGVEGNPVAELLPPIACSCLAPAGNLATGLLPDSRGFTSSY